MSKRNGWRVEEAQRNPAGGEMLLGTVIVIVRRRRAIGDLIGHPGLAEVEQLSRYQSPLHPPLIDVDKLRRIARRGVQQLCRLDDLVGTPQPLSAAEHIAWV